jgi:hypothetical protein
MQFIPTHGNSLVIPLCCVYKPIGIQRINPTFGIYPFVSCLMTLSPSYHAPFFGLFFTTQQTIASHLCLQPCPSPNNLHHALQATNTTIQTLLIHPHTTHHTSPRTLPHPRPITSPLPSSQFPPCIQKIKAHRRYFGTEPTPLDPASHFLGR